jgi:hypothetical protein
LVPEGKALRRSLLAVAAKQNDAGPFSSRGIENEKRASALVSAQWRGRAEGVGFEPTRRSSRLPLFESGTLNHSDTPPHARCRAEALHTYWYARRDSNPRPLGPQPNALSTELRAHDAFLVPVFDPPAPGSIACGTAWWQEGGESGRAFESQLPDVVVTILGRAPVSSRGSPRPESRGKRPDRCSLAIP